MSATTDSHGETMQIIQIADQMQPLMRQLPANVQGGVLASLLARWLADHEIVGDRAATVRIQKRLMHQHFKLIRDLLVATQLEQELGEE